MSQKKKYLEETRREKNEWTSAADIANELNRLAEEILSATMTISGEPLHVGDSLSLVIKKQLKKGVVTCDFLLQTKLASDALTPKSGKAIQPERKSYKAAGGKKVKKDVSRLWKEVVKSVNAGTVPDSVCVSDLLKSCEDYNLNANSAWADLWRDCCNEIKKCTNAAQNGDFDSAKETVGVVNRLTKECHKKFK